jgi:hypothetical protein
MTPKPTISSPMEPNNMPIVWTFPDGHIELTQLSEHAIERARQPQDRTQETVLRLAQEVAEKAPHLKSAIPTLVASKNVPTDRSRRATWKLVDGVILEA